MNHLTARQKQGFAVILAVFLMLAFSVLGYTALNILVNKSDINVKTLASMQAFYLAQAAKNYTLEYYASWGADFTNTTQFPNLTGGLAKTFSPGSFSVSYSNRLYNSAAKPPTSSCSISFTGTSMGISRTFTQDFNSNIPDYFKGAFLSSSGAYNLLSSDRVYADPPVRDIIITGDAYFGTNVRLGWNTCTSGVIDPGVCSDPESCFSSFVCCTGGTAPDCYAGCKKNRLGPSITGNVYVKGDATLRRTELNGNIYASKNIIQSSTTCRNSGSIYPPCNPPICNPNTSVTIPPKPAVTATYYEKEIDIAMSQTAGDLPIPAGNLGGKNYYANGNITIPSGADISGGPLNIVATGNIIVSDGDGNNTGDIGEKISLIAGGTITTGTSTGIGIIAGGNWNTGTSSIDGGGCLFYAKAAQIDNTDDFGGIEIRNNDSNSSRIKGRIIIPSLLSASPNGITAFRYVRFHPKTRFWGVIYTKCINNLFSDPTKGGEVKGSIAMDGPIWAPGYTFDGSQDRFLLRSVNITYSQTEIPIAIKGVYNVTGSNWIQQ